jgi:hypothetical protein
MTECKEGREGRGLMLEVEDTVTADTDTYECGCAQATVSLFAKHSGKTASVEVGL